MMEDMVDELLAPNSARHTSFFHRGFLDALTNRDYRETLAAENSSRRGWYLVGWLSGLARQDRNEEIVDLIDNNPHASEVQDPMAPWAALALPLLFEALCRRGRESEGARIPPSEYLLRTPTLLPALLREGTGLLREDHAERARALFDRLGQVVEHLEAEGEPVTERFFLEVRRRRAHCYRQLREEGRARFEAAAGTESRCASHGAWPLAVQAMARDEWERARELLSLTVSSFLERPNRYSERGLLAQVRLSAGIAEALVMDYTRLARAQELLESGIKEGARIPQPLLSSVLGPHLACVVAFRSGKPDHTFEKEHHDEHHHHSCRHRPYPPVRRRLGLFPSASIARPPPRVGPTQRPPPGAWGAMDRSRPCRLEEEGGGDGDGD